MTLATTPPTQAGFYWFRYDNLASRTHFKVLLQVIQMQPKATDIGGQFVVRWFNQLIPLEQVPEGLWRGPVRDLR